MDLDAVLEIDGAVQRKHVFAAGRLIVHGAINIYGWIRAGLTIKADHDVRTGLGVRAGWSVLVGGCICSDGRITASARIDAGGNIDTGETIWSGCAVTSGGSIHSNERILVGKIDVSDSPWPYRWNTDLSKVFRDNTISFKAAVEPIDDHDNRCNALLADCTTIGLKAAGDIVAADCISCATTIRAGENITAGQAIWAGRSISSGENIIVGRNPSLEWRPMLAEGLEADIETESPTACGKSGIDNALDEDFAANQDCNVRAVHDRPGITGKGISAEGDIWCDGKIRGTTIRAGGSVFSARYVAANEDIIVGKSLVACERIQCSSVIAGWGIESGGQIIADEKVHAAHTIIAKGIISYRRRGPKVSQRQSGAAGFDSHHEPDPPGINQPQSPTQTLSELLVFNTTNTKYPIIKVIGVGGAGCNALDYLAKQDLDGIELIATNTEEQALARCTVSKKLLLGNDGLAAGGNLDVGARAASDSREQIADLLKGSHLVFLVAGLGGGTGTGAGPVIARIANDLGIFTIGLVTYPFRFELGRSGNADAGMASWEKELSSLFVLSNDRLGEVSDADMSMADAFNLIDQLHSDAITGISEVLRSPSLVNMSSDMVCAAIAGVGTIYSACACGPERAREATDHAFALRLSHRTRIKDAKSIFLIVTAARGMKQKEVKKVISAARLAVEPGVGLFSGTTYDDTLGDRMRVTFLVIC